MEQGSGEKTLCRTHLRYYDPVSEAGCEVCRGEASPEGGEKELPWLKLAAALVLLLMTGTFFLGVRPSSAPTSARNIERLVAGPFRQEIEKLEWILYAESSEGSSDAQELVFLLEKLGSEIREWESRLHMTVYLNDIRDFSEWVERRAERGFDDASLAEARREWERVRALVFEPQPWFAER